MASEKKSHRRQALVTVPPVDSSEGFCSSLSVCSEKESGEEERRREVLSRPRGKGSLWFLQSSFSLCLDKKRGGRSGEGKALCSSFMVVCFVEEGSFQEEEVEEEGEEKMI
ncbi:unnamed protein product, partial [Linum tenue]